MVDRVVPLTPELWPVLVSLFGTQGACMGGWCMYWRMPHKDWQAARGDRAKRLFKRRVMDESPPGVLALADDSAVGWMQIGPRLDTPQWNGARRVSAPLASADAEDENVWAATCFFVRPGHRGKGIAAHLLSGGIKFAQKSGARIIEACPMETEGRASASGLYVGHVNLFKRAGFKEVARRKDNRPLMRFVVKGSRKKAN
jgi:GNAT superfamily N-acetyltransferase